MEQSKSVALHAMIMDLNTKDHTLRTSLYKDTVDSYEVQKNEKYAELLTILLSDTKESEKHREAQTRIAELEREIQKLKKTIAINEQSLGSIEAQASITEEKLLKIIEQYSIQETAYNKASSQYALEEKKIEEIKSQLYTTKEGKNLYKIQQELKEIKRKLNTIDEEQQNIIKQSFDIEQQHKENQRQYSENDTNHQQYTKEINRIQEEIKFTLAPELEASNAKHMAIETEFTTLYTQSNTLKEVGDAYSQEWQSLQSQKIQYKKAKNEWRDTLKDLVIQKQALQKKQDILLRKKETGFIDLNFELVRIEDIDIDIDEDDILIEINNIRSKCKNLENKCENIVDDLSRCRGISPRFS